MNLRLAKMVGVMMDARDGQPRRSAGTLAVGLFHPAGDERERLVARIVEQGWSCLTLPAPATGIRAWLEQPCDALIIAPFSGWEEPQNLIALARAIAGSRPLMVLTDRPELEERMVALQSGADDAICRSGDLRELMARLGALLRRSQHARGWLECAELQIDLVDRRVTRSGQLIRMPLREFDLLTNLARRPDHIVPRDTLLRAVWRIDFDPGTNRVEVHMSRLRAKIDRGFDWPMLMTARGQGYALCSHRGGVVAPIAALA